MKPGFHLTDALATTGALAEVFSDRSMLQLMLDVEVALARAEASLGIIPARAAESIAKASSAEGLDAAAIAAETRRSGTPSIAVVHALTARVATIDAESARFVHWGATSQDIADTALILAVAKADEAIGRDQARIDRALRAASDRHARTVMIGRTLLQPAPPVTLGLKIAHWVAAADRSRRRMAAEVAGARILQLGGASGTLAALGDKGPAVARACAAALGLTDPGAPWHTDRDRLAGAVAATGIYAGALGKIARDLSLLMQSEVGEASEPGGGSSTMPQKRNPAASAIALAAATRVPNLVAAFLAGMVQEHERAVGGWHAEWPTVAAVFQTTGSAALAMAEASEGLHVSEARTRANLDATHGTIFAERVSMALMAEMGRDAAHALVAAAVAESARSARAFGDVVRATPDIARHLTSSDLESIDRPESYLGAAEVFRRRLLARE